jgi:hypothetical protein
MRKFIFGLVGLVVLGLGGLVAAVLLTGPSPDRLPPLEPTPPLQPMVRTSSVVVPTAVSNAAIANALEQAAPKVIEGQRAATGIPVLSDGQFVWLINRQPLSVTGRPDGLTVTVPLSGTLRATGTLTQDLVNQLGRDGREIANIIGGLLAPRGQPTQPGQPRSLAFDQTGQVRATITVLAKPQITPNWRIAPNLSSSVAIADAQLPIGPVRLNIAREIRPNVERAVADQVAALEERLKRDPFLENAARREWARMCRAFPLGTGASGVPDLWLEVTPTRLSAAQPRPGAQSLALAFAVEASTRIVPSETKPDCPFPAQLALVAAPRQGHIDVAVPIDVPMTEVNKRLSEQLVGKTFGAQGGAVAATVKRVTVAASGERLVISLRLTAQERNWFGLATEATVNVWGKPALDAGSQMLRLADLAVDVDTDQGFGLVGAALRAAVPYIQPMLAEQAVIDLKPFAADARRRVQQAVSEFSKRPDGLTIKAQVDDLRLTAIAFDARTLRVVAEADGALDVAVGNLAVP